MRILVTGFDGFVGNYLTNELLGRNHDIFGTSRYPVLKSDFPVFEADILDEDKINDVMKKIKPETVIHLAAQSMIPRSWEDPKETYLVNTIGTTNLIRSISRFSPDTKLINIGSSEEYGITAKQGIGLREEMPCSPQNPYALSKYSAGILAMQLAQRNNLRIVHVRAFNHFGPGQKKGFVISDFASQVSKIEISNSQLIYVGNLDVVRDFTDVRDVVKAYALLSEKNVENGIYNVCSSKSTSVKDILNELVGLSNANISVEIDQAKFRPAEVPFFVGDNSKLTAATGWKPELSLSESLEDTLNYWRNRLIEGDQEL